MASSNCPGQREPELQAVLAHSRGVAHRARLHLRLSEQGASSLNAFLTEHGEAHLLELLKHVRLIDTAMGRASRRALQHATDYVEDDMPCVLVIKYDPRNKNKERRTDVRLITGGEIKLDLDLT